MAWLASETWRSSSGRGAGRGGDQQRGGCRRPPAHGRRRRRMRCHPGRLAAPASGSRKPLAAARPRAPATAPWCNVPRRGHAPRMRDPAAGRSVVNPWSRTHVPPSPPVRRALPRADARPGADGHRAVRRPAEEDPGDEDDLGRLPHRCAAVLLRGQRQEAGRLHRRPVPQHHRRDRAADRRLAAAGEVGAGDDAEPLQRHLQRPGRHGVRRQHGDARADARGLVLDPDLPRRHRPPGARLDAGHDPARPVGQEDRRDLRHQQRARRGRCAEGEGGDRDASSR